MNDMTITAEMRLFEVVQDLQSISSNIFKISQVCLGIKPVCHTNRVMAFSDISNAVIAESGKIKGAQKQIKKQLEKSHSFDSDQILSFTEIRAGLQVICNEISDFISCFDSTIEGTKSNPNAFSSYYNMRLYDFCQRVENKAHDLHLTLENTKFENPQPSHNKDDFSAFMNGHPCRTFSPTDRGKNEGLTQEIVDQMEEMV